MRTDITFTDEYDEHSKKNMFCSGIYYFPGTGFFKDRELTFPAHVRRALGRADLRAVVGHFWFGVHRHLGRPATYITLLRDPVDRVLSLFYHLNEDENPKMELEEFLASPPYREVDNDQTRRIAGVEPELGKCTRRTLDLAKDNLRRHFSVVGVTDRFDETLVLLKRKLGWAKHLCYYSKHINRDRPPADSVPQPIRDAILRWNELDRELYDFACSALDELIYSQDEGFRSELRELRTRQEAMLRTIRDVR
jgi:hypothetical protein